MSHSPLCLWKRQLLEHKLKRMVTLDDVHELCEALGFGDPLLTAAWIEKATPEEIEEKLRRKKRKKQSGYEYEYVYAA